MKLKELEDVLYSSIGDLQPAVVWNVSTRKVEAEGCSVEYALDRYGDWDIVRIGAVDNNIVLSVRW